MASKMKALQIWCQKNTEGYKDVKVVNMTSSWRDGLAFCALIHHFRPDLIDFDALSKENILHNNQLAFKTAEDELAIPALLDAEDMVAMKVPDKLSIITYVSQYYNTLHNMKPTVANPLKRGGSPKVLPEQVEVKRKAIPSEKVVKIVPASPSPILSDKKQIFSTCEICKKKVHLVERYIDEGKVYHRQCHRTKSLSGMYWRDKSLYAESNVAKTPQEKAKLYPDNTKTNPFKVMHAENMDVADTVRPATLPTTKSESKSVIDKVKKPKNSIDTSPTVAPAVPDGKTQITTTEDNKNSTGQNKRKSKVLEMAMAYSHRSETNNKENPPHSNQTPVIAVNKNKPDVRPVDNDKPHTEQMEVSSQPDDSGMQTHQITDNTTKIKLSDVTPVPSSGKGEEKDDVVKASEVQKRIEKTTTTTSPASENKPAEDKASINPDAESKEMLPALLKSLSGIAQSKPQLTTPSEATGEKDDLSPSSNIAPLISELPRTGLAPAPKPRSRTGSSDDHIAVKDKPKPKPRSNRSSFDSDHAKPTITTDDYDHSLNPFAMSDTTSTGTTSSVEKEEKPIDSSNPFEESESGEALNPFGDESSDGDSHNAETIKPAKQSKTTNGSLNPFDEDEDEDDDVIDSEDLTLKRESEPTKQSSEATRPKARTINTTSANDARLNPFNVEYENKKQENVPVPPTRRKGHAPPPPSVRKPTPAPTPKSPAPSQVRRQAPEWKNDVEKKMESMNQTNKTDKRYVAKTPDDKPVKPSSPQKAKSPPGKSPTHKSNVQPTSPRQHIKPSRPAPGFGFPLVKRRVKNQMTEEEIMTEMMILDIQLKDLENKGVKLEEVLRDEMELGPELKSESDQMLGEWFELVHEKNKLVRRETDLVFLMQQQRLEQEHADVEFKIRKLLNKPDSEKSDQEKEEESTLLTQLMDIVERRNTIINSIEEERVKEEEEDAAYDRMKMLQVDSPNDSDTTKKKKKNKVKKIFSKRKKNPKTLTKPELPTSPNQPSHS